MPYFKYEQTYMNTLKLILKHLTGLNPQHQILQRDTQKFLSLLLPCVMVWRRLGLYGNTFFSKIFHSVFFSMYVFNIFYLFSLIKFNVCALFFLISENLLTISKRFYKAFLFNIILTITIYLDMS